MTLLALTGVAAVRGGRKLFEALDLSLAPGGAAVVTGPNGAGKTTLLRIAAGLAEPDAGTVSRTGRIAWLGEAAALDAERSLATALRFWAASDDRPGPAARVARGLAAFGLSELAEVPVRLLSAGQRRRGALARTVAGEADLWLLDEPANGLDAAGLALLQQALAAHRAVGGAVLVATHQPIDLPDAHAMPIG